MSMTSRLAFLLTIVAVAAACAPAPTPTATISPPASTTAVTPTPSAQQQGVTKYRIVPEQSEVRYRVREQLARLNFPSDAIGSTRTISGTIVVDSQGNIVPEASGFQVDLSTLKSDEGRRDNFIRQNTLDTVRYPFAKFAPREIKGLTGPPPSSGQITFQLIGDLTIKDVTKPVTWDVTADITGNQVKGQAKTSFTFAEFNLSKPTVMVVLSVDDTINLELDFTLERVSG